MLKASTLKAAACRIVDGSHAVEITDGEERMFLCLLDESQHDIANRDVVDLLVLGLDVLESRLRREDASPANVIMGLKALVRLEALFGADLLAIRAGAHTKNSNNNAPMALGAA